MNEIRANGLNFFFIYSPWEKFHEISGLPVTRSMPTAALLYPELSARDGRFPQARQTITQSRPIFVNFYDPSRVLYFQTAGIDSHWQ